MGIGAGSTGLLGLIHDELRYSLVGIEPSNKIFFVNLKFTKRIDSTMSVPKICGMIFKEVSSINPRVASMAGSLHRTTLVIMSSLVFL